MELPIHPTLGADEIITMQDATPVKDKYRIIGPVYDLLGTLYSGQAIYSCKVAMLTPELIKPGDRVLFAGVGHGRDAIRAAELGAQVTVVDLSATMLRKFRELLERENRSFRYPIREIHSDILKVQEPEPYDMVVANFFLNVFSEAMMVDVMRHLLGLTKAGGQLVVGDFTDSTGNFASRLLKRVYWYAALSLFCLLTKNPFHHMYDYPAHMEKLGLKVQDLKYFKRFNMSCYWSIRAQKPL